MIVTCLLSMTLAAVPGTPEPVQPLAREPDLMGRLYDDDFGYRVGKPHYRTWEATAVARFDHVLVTLDHVTLDDPVGDERTDAISGSLAWTDERPEAWYAIGLGPRLRGDYDGGWIQYHGHKLAKNGYQPTTYEQHPGSAAFVFVNGGWLHWTQPATSAALRAGFEATASGEALSDGQALSALKLRVIGAIGPVCAWAGALDQRHAGRASSRAENAVLEHEEGLAGIAGVSAWWFSYDAIWYPGSELAGAFTLQFAW